jgi:hypothetical protein
VSSQHHVSSFCPQPSSLSAQKAEAGLSPGPGHLVKFAACLLETCKRPSPATRLGRLISGVIIVICTSFVLTAPAVSHRLCFPIHPSLPRGRIIPKIYSRAYCRDRNHFHGENSNPGIRSMKCWSCGVATTRTTHGREQIHSRANPPCYRASHGLEWSVAASVASRRTKLSRWFPETLLFPHRSTASDPDSRP